MFDEYEVPKYKKKAKKKPSKKADHKHDWEPVLIRWTNKNAVYSRERGFTSGVEHRSGSRCKICGKLSAGFSKAFDLEPLPWKDKSWIFRQDLRPMYPDLPIVEADDYYNL